MESKAPIFLVTAEPETEKAVASALGESDRLAPGVVCRSLPELQAYLEKKPAPAAIVDIDLEPGRMLKELESVTGTFSRTRFVVLSREFRNDLVFEAMQAGARHFLSKDSIASELVQALNKVVVLNGSGDGQGAMVAFLSASGGCGATTLAVNLAGELRDLSSEAVLLVDLDTAYGSTGVYLGLSGEYGVADVLSKEIVDRELIETTAVAHSSGLHLLLSPAGTTSSGTAPLAYRQLGAALRACRKAYRYTVVDAPRVPPEAAGDLAERSMVTFIVLQLTVKDVRMARKLMTGLLDRGVPARSVLALVNRYRKSRRTITLEEAEKALGVKPLLISNDFKSAVRGFNFGQLLLKCAKRSSLRKELRSLAQRLIKAHSEKRTLESSGKK